MTKERPADGKTVLITGATSGLGKALAFKFAASKYRVYAIARSKAKAESVKRQVAEKTNESIEILLTDLSSQREVRRLVKKLKKDKVKFNALVNCAGTYKNKLTLTEDGIESTFAVNHLAPFLLTNLLLENKLIKPLGRILTISSIAHALVTLNFKDLSLPKHFNGWRAYCQSKLANILFSNELAKRLETSSITSNAVHPGTISSQLLNTIPKRFSTFTRLVAITPQESAKAVFYLIDNKELQNVSGKYFSRFKQSRTFIWRHILVRQKEFWDLSTQLVSS